MRRFPAGDQLDEVAGRGELTPALVDRLAEVIADFHAAARDNARSRRRAMRCGRWSRAMQATSRALCRRSSPSPRWLHSTQPRPRSWIGSPRCWRSAVPQARCAAAMATCTCATSCSSTASPSSSTASSSARSSPRSTCSTTWPSWSWISSTAGSGPRRAGCSRPMATGRRTIVGWHCCRFSSRSVRPSGPRSRASPETASRPGRPISPLRAQPCHRRPHA